MTAEKAEEMLKQYKTCLGRCGYIQTVIEELKDGIVAMETDARADLIIGSGNQQDGMPHGNTVGNPTERIAMMLAFGFTTSDVTEAKNQLAILEAEYSQKRLVVVFTEAWLQGLPSKEKWMIEKCYFDELTYREINVLYRADFGESCSKDLLRRLKKDALAKIYEMAK